MIGLPLHQIAGTKFTLVREHDAEAPPRLHGLGEDAPSLFQRLGELVDFALKRL